MDSKPSSCEIIDVIRKALELVQRNPDLSQDSPAIREFKFAAIRLMAELKPEASATQRHQDAASKAQKTIDKPSHYDDDWGHCGRVIGGSEQ
jgi:hypothetical protein